MRLSRYGGNPNIGVFAAVGESLAFIAHDCTDAFLREVEEELGVEAFRATVAGSFVVGSLMAMNSNGAVVSGLADPSEAAAIGRRLPVALLDDRLNAAGNNILVNDRGAIVNPGLSAAAVAAASDALGVECVPAPIAGMAAVGSACVATNSGAAVHPDATDEDLRLIREVLKVEPARTTLNHGSRLIAPCVLANSKGALAGDSTTPIEMGRLEDALRLY